MLLTIQGLLLRYFTFLKRFLPIIYFFEVVFFDIVFFEIWSPYLCIDHALIYDRPAVHRERNERHLCVTRALRFLKLPGSASDGSG